MKLNRAVISVFMFLQINLAYAEGFIAGTEIKTPHGYIKIEDLCVGDSIISNDSNQNCVETQITYLAKKTTNKYASIKIGNENICVACDQQFYKEDTHTWAVADSLKNDDLLSGHAIMIEHVNQPIEVYLLSTAKYHNFFVTKTNICVHNFFPPVILAISAAFGLGSAELTGISFGLAGLGSFLGYQWHKKNKDKHKISIEPQFYGNGMMPEDPENEKKRKRDEAIKEYKPLSKKEAKEIAKDFGHREVKDHPCGNTRNQPVFFNGKNYISPDIDGHNGGLWKVFDRRGNILHSASRRFEEIVKTYKK